VIRARELVNGVPSDDPLTSATAKATVTIRDVNDSPPVFNHKEYSVSLLENTPPGTPLALDMSVSDADVGINSKFALRLPINNKVVISTFLQSSQILVLYPMHQLKHSLFAIRVFRVPV